MSALAEPERMEVTAGRTPVLEQIREFLRFRELLYFFVWRELKVRYKQTAFGIAWAVLQPFLLMVVFTLIFGRLGRLSPEGVPGPVFYYAGVLPWTYFSMALTQGTGSLVTNQNMVRKVYFPRVILPLSVALSGLVDLGVAFVILLLLMVVYSVPIGAAIAVLPLFVLIAIVTAFATTLWTSALNAVYRDLRYAVPLLVQFWFFASPIVYSSEIVVDELPPVVASIYFLNPMAHVVDGFRWAILDLPAPPASMLPASLGLLAVALVAGLRFFWNWESTIADLV